MLVIVNQNKTEVESEKLKLKRLERLFSFHFQLFPLSTLKKKQ